MFYYKFVNPKGDMSDSAAKLELLLKQYRKNHHQISVNFRALEESITSPDIYTHLIHPYTAKLLPHIPRFFLSNDILSQRGDIVLDPFSGSGTVLLEGMLAQRNVIGADCNPIARLIARTKLSFISPVTLQDQLDDIMLHRHDNIDCPYPNVTNLAFWYTEKTIKKLQIIKLAIDNITNKTVQDFFLTCFSNCTKKVSFANPDFTVPVKLNALNYASNPTRQEKIRKLIEKIEDINVFDSFYGICVRNIKRIATIEHLHGMYYQMLDDAKALSTSSQSLQSNSVQLIITSPPYAGAQKYIRSCSLGLGWLGFCEKMPLSAFKRQEIGREDFPLNEYTELYPTNVRDADRLLRSIYKENPLRAHVASCYLREMRQVILESYRVLRQGGYMVLVAGNNKVCKHDFMTTKYLKTIAIQEGFKVKLSVIDDIKSRGLMTTRNKTASIINSETVLLLKK